MPREVGQSGSPSLGFGATPAAVGATATPPAPTPGRGRRKRTTITDRPILPFGKTVTETYEPDPYEDIQIKVTGTMKELAAKEKRESKQLLGRATGKLLQSYYLFNKMNKWTKENVGNIPAAFGMRGAVNYLGGKTKLNPWTETFEGDQNTTAMAFARAIMPTRAAAIIEMVKKTLPSIWSSDDIASNQTVYSLVDAIDDYADKNPDEFMKVDKAGKISGRNPTDPKSIAIFRKRQSVRIRNILKDIKNTLGQIPEEAEREDGFVMINPETKKIIIADYGGSYDDMLDKGFRIINKTEANRLKKQGVL